MSTKKIREALEAFRTSKPVATDIWYSQAMVEVEAIEKSAKALKRWNDNGGRGIDLDAARGFDVFEAIAKEAKT